MQSSTVHVQAGQLTTYKRTGKDKFLTAALKCLRKETVNACRCQQLLNNDYLCMRDTMLHLQTNRPFDTVPNRLTATLPELCLSKGHAFARG